MAGVKKLVVAILFLTLPILSFASGAENHANRAVINLIDGSKIVGQILKKDTQKVYVAVAGTVFPLDRKDIKDIKVSGKKEKGFTEIKKTGLYRIGKGTVKPVSAHVEHLAPAIVVVKTPSGAGTGWFCNPDGHVITNHHVIARERSITVTAFKKTENNFKRKIYKKVKIIAVSTKMDLALLKIEEDLDLDIPQLYIGDSTKVESGDEVFTIGNPLLLERSTHKGIISKTSRNYEGRLFLQTATPINPGNSGGPLFNGRGEVIGVVNMGYIFMEGLGFAIPSKYIIEFLDNVDAFAYDPSNPNTGKKYMEAPIRSTDGAIEFTRDAFLKTGAGIQCLTLADVTGDGAQEVFFVNNNKGEIGIIKGRQKAPPPRQILTYEDINKLPPNRDFKLDSIPVHNRIYSLRIADMTGDGIKDIVFYGDLDGLCLIPGKKNGSWGQKRKMADIDVSQARDALRIADIDNDGKNEIFALSKGKFTVVNRGAEHREFPLNAAFWGSIRRYLLHDVNGDGRLDVLFFCTSKQYATRLYVQDEEGNFAREELVESSIQGPVVPYERGDDTLRMLTLEKGRNRIIELTLETDSIKTEKARVTPSVITVALAEGGKATDDFVLADIYGSPAPEILTSSKADNEFLMLHPHQDGIAIVRSPSPRKVTGLALYSREKGENLLFSCSNQDDLFGISRVQKSGISYPRPINTDGEVEFFYCVSLHGKEPSLVWAEKQKGRYILRKCPARQVAEKFVAQKEGSIAVEAQTLTFGEDEEHARTALRSKPSGLAFADFNGDTLSDIVIYWAYSGKESLYLGRANNHFTPVITDREFIKKQEKHPLLTADVDQDGRRDVLLMEPEFVRMLKVDDKNQLYVEKQFNWKWGQIERLVPYGKEKPPRLLAVSGNQARVVELNTEENKFSLVSTIDLTGLQRGLLKVADVDGNGKKDILMLGQNTLQVLYQRKTRRIMGSSLVFNPRSESFSYWKIHPAQLDGKGPQEVLLFDSKKAMMEICRPDEEGNLDSICRHRVFEKSIQQRRESQSYELPNEVQTGDIDGNGQTDLIFVLDDRVAIYLQGKTKSAAKIK